MSASTSEYLDLKKPHNYFLFFIGIAVESAAVLLLMIVGFLISILAFWVL
jgi:hypothetical protein